jgi:hypothetical protein
MHSSLRKWKLTLFFSLSFLWGAGLAIAADTRPKLPEASISKQCLALFPKLSRRKNTQGGFAYGITPEEMAEIARDLSTEQHRIMPIPGKSFEQVLINAAYRKSFWEKIGVVIRDIAGSHLLNDANHRMAYIVTKRLIERNGIYLAPLTRPK